MRMRVCACTRVCVLGCVLGCVLEIKSHNVGNLPQMVQKKMMGEDIYK